MRRRDLRHGEANTDDAVLCNGQTVALPADRTYTKLYVLASAVEEPRTAEFRVGDRTYEAEVPLWKGFYGQWGWYGNSEGFMQRAKIGYLGTHRHQTDLGNVPYGFSYMYLLTFDIPEGGDYGDAPRDKKVLVYAMTASNNPIDDVKLASRTFVRPTNDSATVSPTLLPTFFREKAVPVAGRPFRGGGRPFASEIASGENNRARLL